MQWDQGLGGIDESDWADLLGYPTNSLLLKFVATNGIVGGQLYKFRLRASNIYGFGLFSDIVTFKSSQEPDQVASSTIMTENVHTKIKVTWNEPFDNYDDILAYLIEFRRSDYSTFTPTAECDGSDDTIITTRTCYVEL